MGERHEKMNRCIQGVFSRCFGEENPQFNKKAFSGGATNL